MLLYPQNTVVLIVGTPKERIRTQPTQYQIVTILLDTESGISNGGGVGLGKY